MDVQSILIVCEGKTDQAFLTYLKFLFQSRNNNIRIAIKQRKVGGGSPYDIVLYAARTRGEFSCRIALFDTDRSIQEVKKAEKLATKKAIHTIRIDVCLEKLLLQILNQRMRKYESCKEYKKQFREQYISNTKMQQQQEYKTVFPKPLLEKQRKKIPPLNTIITYIQHGCEGTKK